RHVDLITLRRQDTIEHIDAGFLEHCDALATMARVGIDTADDHPLDASCDQGLCARRRLLAIDALLAGARLEGYHGGVRALATLAGEIQGHRFGVATAEELMMTAGNDFAV